MEEITDDNLKYWESIGLNRIPLQVTEEMADPNQDKNDDWRVWRAIPSTVTDDELREFEELIGAIGDCCALIHPIKQVMNIK